MWNGRGVAALLVAFGLLLASRSMRTRPAPIEQCADADGERALVEAVAGALRGHDGNTWLRLLVTGRDDRSGKPPFLGRCTFAPAHGHQVVAYYWLAAGKGVPLAARRLTVPRGPFGSLMSICNPVTGGRRADGPRSVLAADAELITAPLYLVSPQ